MLQDNDPIPTHPLTVNKMPKKNPYFYRRIDGRLPHCPNMMLVGATNSGKTNLIIDLLTDKDKFKNYFKVFIFSKNVYNDTIWETNLKVDLKYISHRYSQTKIEKIRDSQLRIRSELMKKNKNLKNFKPVLIILDDLLGSQGMMSARSVGFLESLFTGNRHSNIRIWFSTQYYRAVSKIIRQNCSDKILFYNSSEKERADMLAENGGKIFEKFFDYATAEEYEFLFYTNSGDRDKRFRKGFDTYLTLNGEEVIENKLVIPPLEATFEKAPRKTVLNKKRDKQKRYKYEVHYDSFSGYQRVAIPLDDTDDDENFTDSDGE